MNQFDIRRQCKWCTDYVTLKQYDKCKLEKKPVLCEIHEDKADLVYSFNDSIKDFKRKYKIWKNALISGKLKK
jgi:hypothetical protein